MINMSFIIPTNTVYGLDKTIESINRSVRNAGSKLNDYEIIVVFNNLKECMVLKDFNDPRVKIVSTEFRGAYNARLYGVQKCTKFGGSHYVLFTDCGDTYTDEGISVICNDLTTHQYPTFYMFNIMEVPYGYTQYNYKYHRPAYKSIAFNNVVSAKDWIDKSLNLCIEDPVERIKVLLHPYIYSPKPCDFMMKIGTLDGLGPNTEYDDFNLGEDILFYHQILNNNLPGTIAFPSENLRCIVTYLHYSGGISSDTRSVEDAEDQYRRFYKYMKSMYYSHKLKYFVKWINYSLGYDIM